ncbi:ABC transporter substrate-binding protein [Candidatus Poribacteria bacterium]|nr:ABC transporter substrate-binding protein [Candidatus Poribacteria bacterium]
MNIRRIITFASVLAIVVLAIGLSSCDRVPSMMPDPETPPMEETPPMADEGITIGVALALTGGNAEPYGIPMQEGLELAREEINMLGGPSITFVTEDALSTVEGAKAAVQKLVDQGVPAIVGIGISTHLEQAFPIAQDAGVIAFSPISSAAGLSSLGDYIFRAGLAVNILNPIGLEITQATLGYTKVATIHDAADTYSTSSNAEIVKALEAGGIQILAQETFQTDDTDFMTQLTNIMNLDPQPEALFISALSTEMVEVIKQGRAAGIPDSVHFIVPDLTITEVQAAGDAAEGTITVSGWSAGSDAPGNQAFVQNYQAKYGSEPLPWAAQAYATLHILANAIMKAESTDAAMIRDALAMTMDLDTILGKFSFDPNGEAMYDRVRERVVHIVKDGQLQPFGEEE